MKLFKILSFFVICAAQNAYALTIESIPISTHRAACYQPYDEAIVEALQNARVLARAECEKKGQSTLLTDSVPESLVIEPSGSSVECNGPSVQITFLCNVYRK